MPDLFLPISTLFFWLLVGHVLCDYPLQGDFLSRAKSRSNPTPGIPWWMALGAHSLLHAGAVMLATNSLFLAMGEFFAHSLIDFGKGSKYYGFRTDQFLHVACKILWTVLYFTILA